METAECHCLHYLEKTFGKLKFSCTFHLTLDKFRTKFPNTGFAETLRNVNLRLQNTFIFERTLSVEMIVLLISQGFTDKLTEK